MNITELARRLKIPTEQLKDELPKLGFDIGRRAIKIDDMVAEKVTKLWAERQQERYQSQYVVVEKKLGTQAPAQARRSVELPAVISTREFAALLGMPVATVIGELFKNGVMASINEKIDYETAAIISQDLGYTTSPAKAPDTVAAEVAQAKGLRELLAEQDVTKLKARAPVVVVMGHVDHGKTTLLDTIRSTNVAGGESGAITQHIGAYQVTTEKGRKITFLDTPGHEAFSAMRSRGGRLADIAIIVVAADDGLQPQTIEAIEIAQREKLAFLFAINKVDKDTSDIERVKKALAELNLLPEDWGGKTICVPISAKKKQGIPELLDMVLLLADLEKLQANPETLAAGTIIEAHLDSGEGPVATALVQVGTLKVGDYMIAGEVAGKVRGMKDYRGKAVREAGPAMPVRVLGLKQPPQAGDTFRVPESEAEVREVLRHQPKFQRTADIMAGSSPVVTTQSSTEEKASDLSLNVILKADVLGSREAILAALGEIKGGEVRVKVVRAALGSITEGDVAQAEASHAIILGFNVPLIPQAELQARAKGIQAKTYKVIYDLIDEVKSRLSQLLKPELLRSQVGEGEIIKIFRRGKRDAIVGCRIKKGVVRPNIKARVIHNGVTVLELSVVGVRIGHEPVGEVAEGGECGVSLAGDPIVSEGDILEFYHEEVRTRSVA